jgi:hypothetical protein
MLLLKKTLRQTYGLTDERLQHFSPTEAPQKEEARVLKEVPLGLEQVPPPPSAWCSPFQFRSLSPKEEAGES